MTNSRTIKTAAPSTRRLVRPTTLILAAVVALEVIGLRALPPGDAAPAVVAETDAFKLAAAPVAPVHHKVPSVEISIVAQADTPAR